MNILLIEDDPHLGPALMRRFIRRGHTVQLAPTIAAAQRQLLVESYSVIVTDRDVPDGNAWAYVADYVKLRGVRAVFMSGRAPTDLAPLEFFFKGQDDLQKLFNLVEAA